jgi:hypothetical protein
MKIFFSLILWSIAALATDLDKRPPSFPFLTGIATFVDIQRAYYEITYDQDAKKARVRAHLEYLSAEEGFTIFDSLSEPTSIRLDGIQTTATLTPTPDKKTFVRVVNLRAQAGMHLLEIELPLTLMVEFAPTGVKNGFFMGDLADREYMEKYLPTNFVFDRIPMVLKLNFTRGTPQRIYANGEVTQTSATEYWVEFPAKLMNACPFFHTVPVETFAEREFSFNSMNGKVVPILIYTSKEEASDFDALEALTLKVLTELEGDYGPFLHPKVIIQAYRGSGGMEYSGATQASMASLSHELFHSYYARGVMPSDGNSGWIDEALARWRDGGYKRPEGFKGTSNIASHGPYNRKTDIRSYAYGSQVMGYFDLKFKDRGGLRPFLKDFIGKRAFDPISTQEFVQAMNTYYGVDNSMEFERFVFGKEGLEFQSPAHEKISPEQLKDLL